MPFPLALIPLIISGGTAVIGASMAIADKVKAKRAAAKSAKEKAASGRYELDADDLKLVNTLSADEKKIFDSVLPYIESHAEELLNELPKIDLSQLEQLSQQQPQMPQVPGAEELGFPPVQDVTGDIRSETDFAPIEKQSMRNFQEQILPMIKEQFAGVGGGTRSSAYQGAAQAGGERLAESLAALRSKYGLDRGSVLGQLGLKQGALEQQRALGAGQLGSQRYQLGQQGQAQQFGQGLNLANLGLQQNAQELQRRQLGLGAMSNLLNRGGLTPVIPPAPIGAGQGLGAQFLGSGLSGLGNVDYATLFKSLGNI
jgi:hypothetical protein